MSRQRNVGVAWVGTLGNCQVEIQSIPRLCPERATEHQSPSIEDIKRVRSAGEIGSAIGDRRRTIRHGIRNADETGIGRANLQYRSTANLPANAT